MIRLLSQSSNKGILFNYLFNYGACDFDIKSITMCSDRVAASYSTLSGIISHGYFQNDVLLFDKTICLILNTQHNNYYSY